LRYDFPSERNICHEEDGHIIGATYSICDADYRNDRALLSFLISDTDHSRTKRSEKTMNSFFPFLIVLFVASCAWTILELSLGQRKRRWMGLLGAWTATLILAGLWQSEALPWIVHLIQGVLLLWLGSIIALMVAVVLIWLTKEPGRRRILCCALVCLFVDIATLLNFFWIATVSPSGV
jgi:hypothetical protein